MEATEIQNNEEVQEDLVVPEEKTKRDVVARQGFFYLVVGFSSALLELVLFQALYRFGICSVEISNVIAVTTSTAFNFTMNFNVTFKEATHPGRSLVKYLLLFVFNTTFTTITISWLVGMGWDSLFAKLCTMACVVLWNFILYRKVIFT